MKGPFTLQFNFWNLMLIVFCMTLVANGQQITNTAALELANTFQQVNTFTLGAKLGQTLVVGNGAYSLTLPDSPPQPGSILQNDSVTPGKLIFSPSCAGFTAGGDISGTSSSQSVIGLNNIPIDQTVQPTDNMFLKYKSATGKWTPSN